MKEHVKTHSFQKLIYKCEDCDYFAPDEISMEVHAGRKHSGNFECGICGFVGKDSKNLEDHLQKCEMFKCSKCDLTFMNLETLKQHLEKKHPKNLNYLDIQLIKMDRKNCNLVSSCTHSAYYLSKQS